MVHRELPPEVIEQCLQQLGPLSAQSVQALVRCQAVSRDLQRLATQNAIWEPHLAQWKHHSPRSGRSDSQSDTGPMYAFNTFKRRWLADRKALEVVENLINEPLNRCAEFDTLDHIGMDAWDILHAQSQRLQDLAQWQTFEVQEGPQWLSRRHWLIACLGFLARRDAMHLLQRIAEPDQSDVPFEDALTIFSSFLGADRLIIRSQLQQLADQCRERVSPELDSRDLVAVSRGIHAFMTDTGSERRLTSVFR